MRHPPLVFLLVKSCGAIVLFIYKKAEALMFHITVEGQIGPTAWVRPTRSSNKPRLILAEHANHTSVGGVTLAPHEG